MYLKGYQIKYGHDKILTLRKWDFGGDTSHTNSAWNGMLSELRSLSHESYPISILDLDKENSTIVTINNQQEFEDWMKNNLK